MKIRNLSQLFPYLRLIVNDALENEVKQEVIKLEQTWILREVYLSYRPMRYERRGNAGGLISNENIIGEMNLADSRLTVRNVTQRSLTYTNEYLAPTIEYGHKEAVRRGYHGYDFQANPKKYYYMNPRPFTEKTKEDLRNNKQHIAAMKDGLKRQGINYK